MRRVAMVAAVMVGLALLASPARADGQVANCGGDQPLGVLTCSVVRPAMIDGTSFAGDGGSSAGYQWVGSLDAPARGTLTLDYTYTGIFNTLFAKLGIRLSTDQPTCLEEPFESESGLGGPLDRRRGSRTDQCAGDLRRAGDLHRDLRAATDSLGGSFIGVLTAPTVTFTPVG